MTASHQRRGIKKNRSPINIYLKKTRWKSELMRRLAEILKGVIEFESIIGVGIRPLLDGCKLKCILQINS